MRRPGHRVTGSAHVRASCDLAGPRQRARRAPRRRGLRPPDPLVPLCRGADDALERLTGVYRVLKPHLVETYAAHLARANPIYEPPTRRILERCLAEERRHVEEGERALAALADTEARRARVAAWAAELGALLARAGGVTGGNA